MILSWSLANKKQCLNNLRKLALDYRTDCQGSIGPVDETDTTLGLFF